MGLDVVYISTARTWPLYHDGPNAAVMASYEIDVPEGVPADVEVRCTDHGTTQTFPQHRSTLPFHCPECEVELAIDLHDTGDWRELTERC